MTFRYDISAQTVIEQTDYLYDGMGRLSYLRNWYSYGIICSIIITTLMTRPAA